MNTVLTKDFLNFSIYPEMATMPTLVYSGNEKKTLIVLKNTGTDNIPFLTSILKAIRFDVTKDVVLFHFFEKDTTSLQFLKKKFEIKNVLLFGINPSQVGIQAKIPHYYPIEIANTKFLVVEDLNIIEKNVGKKKQLWGGLQQLFLS